MAASSGAACSAGRRRHRSRTWAVVITAVTSMVCAACGTLDPSLHGSVPAGHVDTITGVAADPAADAAGTGQSTGGSNEDDAGTRTGVGPGTTGAAPVERPGETIAQQVAQQPPGARIQLGAGVYRITEAVRPKDGQTIAGVPGTIVSGAALLTSWRRSGDHWVTTVPDAVDVPDAENFDLYVDDSLAARVAPGSAQRAGTWSFDADTDEVRVGTDPAGHRIELSTVAHAFEGPASDVSITGMVVEKFAPPAQKAAVSSHDGQSWRIANNEIRFSHAAGVMAGTGTTVVNNLVHHNGQIGVKAWAAHDVQIRGNRIYQNNTLRFDTFWEAGGIKLSNTRDVEVSSNTVSNNIGFGIWSDHSGEGLVYSSNTVTGNTMAGIHHEASFSAVIDSNTITGNGSEAPEDAPYGGAGIYVYDGRDVEIVGNVIRGNRCGVVALVHDRGSADESNQPQGLPLEVRNLRVHDNTIEMSVGYSGLIVQPRAEETGALMDVAIARSFFTSAGNRWFDNTYRGTGYRDGGSPSARFVWADPRGGSSTEAWTTPRYLGQSEWLASGQDSGSVFDVTP